jgi:hypothetical protein
MEDQPHATALTKNEIIRSGLKQGWLPHCVGNRAISPSSRPVTVSPMRGPGWRAQVRDAVMLAFLPSLDPLRVASVCTGALILGAAGLIAGRGAATTAPLTILKSLAPGQRPARRPGRRYRRRCTGSVGFPRSTSARRSARLICRAFVPKNHFRPSTGRSAGTEHRPKPRWSFPRPSRRPQKHSRRHPAAASSNWRSGSDGPRTRSPVRRSSRPFIAAQHHLGLDPALCFFRVRFMSCSCATGAF